MSKLKIAVASLQQESNSLLPVLTVREDFDQAFGDDMLEKVHISDLLEAADAEPVTTLYAHALPGGPVAKEDYLFFADKIIAGIPATGIDGIWLYLHGAMYVDGIGSGEEYLLSRLREKVGYGIPIAVGMDFHANNHDNICKYVNYVCGFRTAPHEDQIETERRAMRGLLKCIEKGILPHPQMSRAYVAVAGDAVQTALPPLCDIMRAAEETERQPGVLCAQVFAGQSWVDVPYMGPSMIVTHESDEALAKSYADKLAAMFYEVRHEFGFLIEAVEAQEAVRRALSSDKQVFMTDSGDNTTAGAAGDSAYLLNVFKAAGAQGVLIAGIMDSAAVDACYAANIGDTLHLTIGGSLDPSSQKADITGRLIRRGDILAYTGGNAGRAATLDCGGITVIITEKRAAFIRLEIFESADIDVNDYKTIVVKLGYLFPELAKIAPRAILALTPGGSTESLAQMGHKHIHRPMFPLDDNFM